MSVPSDIAAARTAILDRIAKAAAASGRAPVTLTAVSKQQPDDRVEAVLATGQRVFGENRVQEAEEKKAALAHLMDGPDPLRLELIGALQSNKARKAVVAVSRIQSIDSADLGARVGRIAAEMGRTLPVFVEVDLAGEATKAGVPEVDLTPCLEMLARVEGLKVEGLMAIPPFLENPEDVRPYFRRLRELRDASHARGLLAGRELSMGMSHDFEVAIAEGATVVRVGTAIFGERPVRG